MKHDCASLGVVIRVVVASGVAIVALHIIRIIPKLLKFGSFTVAENLDGVTTGNHGFGSEGTSVPYEIVPLT